MAKKQKRSGRKSKKPKKDNSRIIAPTPIATQLMIDKARAGSSDKE